MVLIRWTLLSCSVSKVPWGFQTCLWKHQMFCLSVVFVLVLVLPGWLTGALSSFSSDLILTVTWCKINGSDQNVLNFSDCVVWAETTWPPGGRRLFTPRLMFELGSSSLSSQEVKLCYIEHTKPWKLIHVKISGAALNGFGSGQGQKLQKTSDAHKTDLKINLHGVQHNSFCFCL